MLSFYIERLNHSQFESKTHLSFCILKEFVSYHKISEVKISLEDIDLTLQEQVSIDVGENLRN
jgi:hypothetical protein